MAGKRRATSQVVASNGLLERLLELQAMAQMQIAEAEERFARLGGSINQHSARIDGRLARVDGRFAHLEQAITTVFCVLEELPRAVRDKIGFAAKP